MGKYEIEIHSEKVKVSVVVSRNSAVIVAMIDKLKSSLQIGTVQSFWRSQANSQIGAFFIFCYIKVFILFIYFLQYWQWFSKLFAQNEHNMKEEEKYIGLKTTQFVVILVLYIY